MQVFVQTPLGKTIALDVEASDTVGAVKGKLVASEGVPPEQQRLSLAGRRLEDKLRLGQCGVAAGSTLQLTLRLLVKIVTGRTVAVDVELSDTIEHLKARIHEQEGIPLEQQRLLFAAKQLEGDRTIYDYNLHRIFRPVYLVRQVDWSAIPTPQLARGLTRDDWVYEDGVSFKAL
mmetsp:Transcript_85481/g.276841  ORF Transcript_85481/g.276841 Transcript_85481/m.276841 type:complete len:175 (+) Transcript_85481:571-1095(+)